MRSIIFLIMTLVVLAISGFGQTSKVKPRLELISERYSGLSADVYRITGGEGFSSATFSLIFGCITTDLEKMVMSEKEIFGFLQNDSDWLNKKNETNWPAPLIFLVKVDGKYFAKRMYAYSREYATFTRFYDQLNEQQSWDIFCQPLIIVPKIKTLKK